MTQADCACHSTCQTDIQRQQSCVWHRTGFGQHCVSLAEPLGLAYVTFFTLAGICTLLFADVSMGTLLLCGCPGLASTQSFHVNPASAPPMRGPAQKTSKCSLIGCVPYCINQPKVCMQQRVVLRTLQELCGAQQQGHHQADGKTCNSQVLRFRLLRTDHPSNEC